jgi:hypothetical protein
VDPRAVELPELDSELLPTLEEDDDAVWFWAARAGVLGRRWASARWAAARLVLPFFFLLIHFFLFTCFLFCISN